MRIKKNNNLIKMTLEGVRVEVPSNKPILLLKEEKGNRYLPIWIGPFEASAIALELSNIKTPRPMTHDLIMNIINNLKTSIDNIEITDIKNNTFYAIINIGMVMGLMPATGLPLPLLSYGGSSVVSALWAIGILFSIHIRRFTH